MNINEIDTLSEAAFNPKTFGQAIETGQKEGVLVGFEFEVCVPKKVIDKIKPHKFKIDYDAFIAKYFESTGSFLNIETSEVSTKKMDSLFKIKENNKPKFPTFADALKYAKENDLDYSDYGQLNRIIFRISTVTVERYLNDYFEYDGKKVFKFLKSLGHGNTLAYELDNEQERLGMRYSTDYGKVANLLLKPELSKLYGTDVKVFTEYHQQRKDSTSWYIEPDTSLEPNSYDEACEIVSPPIPAQDAMEALKKFYAFAKKYKFYTDASNNTGLHINVSIPKDIDLLKLALFIGDKYALQKFGRENNEYARSVLASLQQHAPNYDVYTTKTAQGKSKVSPLSIPKHTTLFNMRTLVDLAKAHTGGHYSSISTDNNGKYISFRSAGGDYLNQYQDVINIVGRFVQAMIIASDSELYKKEYIKKLTQLVGAPANTTPQNKIMTVLKDIREYGLPVPEFIMADLQNPQELQHFKRELTDSLGYYRYYDFGKFLDKNTMDISYYPKGYSYISSLRNDIYIPKKKNDDVSADIKSYAIAKLVPEANVDTYHEYVNAVRKFIENHQTERSRIDGSYYDTIVIANFNFLSYSDPIVQKFVKDLMQKDDMTESSQYPEKPTYYFAYGMLTNPKLMRGGNLIGVGELKNFEYKMYQFANVEESTGHTTYGCLWEIDRAQLQRLDRMEGYPTMYDRKTYPVYVDGKKYEAEVFVMTPETRYYVQGTYPSRGYIEDVARGYLNAGVPTAQLAHSLEVAKENMYGNYG